MGWIGHETGLSGIKSDHFDFGVCPTNAQWTSQDCLFFGADMDDISSLATR